MKKLLLIAILFSGAILLSCNREEIPANNDVDVKSVAIDEMFNALTVDEIQIAIDQFSGFGDGFLKSGEVVESTTCPVVTVEKTETGKEWPRKVTVDFGQGCSKNEKQFSGKMIIIKTGPWMTSGSVREVTFENFVMDKVKVSGNKRLENLTANGKIVFSIKINITLTTVDETGKEIKIIKRTENRTQSWNIDVAKFGMNMGLGMGMGKDFAAGIGFEMTGTSVVSTQKDGQEMVAEKKATAVKTVFGCRFPQAGVIECSVKSFDGKESKFKIDFSAAGESSDCKPGCDCIAALTVNGTTTQIDLTEKWKEKLQNN